MLFSHSLKNLVQLLLSFGLYYRNDHYSVTVDCAIGEPGQVRPPFLDELTGQQVGLVLLTLQQSGRAALQFDSRLSNTTLCKVVLKDFNAFIFSDEAGC